MDPTAHWALDLRLDRGRPTLTGWRARVTLRDIKRGGTTGKPMYTVRYDVCRAFYIGRTAKAIFAVRFPTGARQT
jgi:hypothetical protein